MKTMTLLFHGPVPSALPPFSADDLKHLHIAAASAQFMSQAVCNVAVRSVLTQQPLNIVLGENQESGCNILHAIATNPSPDFLTDFFVFLSDAAARNSENKNLILGALAKKAKDQRTPIEASFGQLSYTLMVALHDACQQKTAA